MPILYHHHLKIKDLLVDYRDKGKEALAFIPGDPETTKNKLIENMNAGVKVIPWSSEPCDKFDFTKNGCPGHMI